MALPQNPYGMPRQQYDAMLRQLQAQQGQTFAIRYNSIYNNQLGVPINGGHRQASQALQGYPSLAPSPGNAGTVAHQLAMQAAQGIFDTPTPEPIEDAGIRAGEVIAWRCWRIHHGFLRSCFTETIWAPGEPMEGSIKVHGVHAWKSLSKALEYGLRSEPIVFGQVELWGDIVEHEHGYRSEFAAIKSLDGILEDDRETLAALRKLYNVGGRDDLTPEKRRLTQREIDYHRDLTNTNPYGGRYASLVTISHDPEPEPTMVGAFEGAFHFAGAAFLTISILCLFWSMLDWITGT